MVYVCVCAESGEGAERKWNHHLLDNIREMRGHENENEPKRAESVESMVCTTRTESEQKQFSAPILRCSSLFPFAHVLQNTKFTHRLDNFPVFCFFPFAPYS